MKKGPKSGSAGCEANVNKVFIVEDSDVYRTFLVENISRLTTTNPVKTHYSIDIFTSGEECIEKLYLKPDVVVLDYFLDSGGYIENMNGLALLKQLKQMSPGTKVIVLSCQTKPEIIKAMMINGAYSYVKKDNYSPLKVNELIESILVNKEKDTNWLRFLFEKTGKGISFLRKICSPF